jgi:hypothetical protein
MKQFISKFKSVLIFTLANLLISTLVFSQAPEKMSYQSVLRGTNNALVTNQNVRVKISILQGTITGSSVYSEEHITSTNSNGLVSLSIGGGTLIGGSFSGINWANGPYFVKMEADPTGGTNYTISGTTQLMSVPYALYAKTSGSSTPGPQGTPGENGINGQNSLVKTTTEPSGANCANGGIKIETGLDVNGNGVLDVSEVNASQTKYVCNGAESANSINPIQTGNTNGNYTIVSGIPLPSFLNYFGDCSSGNKICTNNELLVNNSKYCNLSIPVGVTAKINPEITTIIYVSDTLFLKGTINGVGANAGANAMNATTNHLGATASGYSIYQKCALYSVGGSDLIFSWLASNQPDSYYESMGGTVTIPVGNFNNTVYSCETGPACSATNGTNLSTDNLLLAARFGLDISGGNAAKISKTSSTCSTPDAKGGQGGAGLYILARNVVFQGNITLNGGNGSYLNDYCNSSSSNRWLVTGGGGGGSFVLRTNNLITNTGSFVSNGGGRTGPNACTTKGGNGSMVVLTGQ